MGHMPFLDELLGGLRTVLNNGVAVPFRTAVNFVGAAVLDDDATSSTVITVPPGGQYSLDTLIGPHAADFAQVNFAHGELIEVTGGNGARYTTGTSALYVGSSRSSAADDLKIVDKPNGSPVGGVAQCGLAPLFNTSGGQIGTAGLVMRDTASGKCTTFGATWYNNALGLAVSHYNSTTGGHVDLVVQNVPIGLGGLVYLTCAWDAVNMIYSYSVDGEVYSELTREAVGAFLPGTWNRKGLFSQNYRAGGASVNRSGATFYHFL